MNRFAKNVNDKLAFAYEGQFWHSCVQRYLKSPDIEIRVQTIKDDCDLIIWEAIEKTVIEIEKLEYEIYELSEKILVTFFQNSNLYNYDYFRSMHGIFVPTNIILDYDNQHVYDNQKLREFEITFEPDYWNDRTNNDFELVVKIHNYKTLFVNGVRWNLKDSTYMRPKQFQGVTNPNSILEFVFGKQNDS